MVRIFQLSGMLLNGVDAIVRRELTVRIPVENTDVIDARHLIQIHVEPGGQFKTRVGHVRIRQPTVHRFGCYKVGMMRHHFCDFSASDIDRRSSDCHAGDDSRLKQRTIVSTMYRRSPSLRSAL